MKAQDAEFVGSKVCRQCHQSEYKAWLTSDHRNAMQPADQDNVLGNFNDVTVEFHGIESRLYRKDEVFRIETVGKNGKRESFEIAYTFGHYPVQQYLVDIGNGHLQALNIAWDSRDRNAGGQRWYHLQTDEKLDPEHPFFWTNHFQNANSRCIECHATDVSKNYDAESASYATSWIEVGVGCETCHGAASRHLQLARDKKLNATDKGFQQSLPKRIGWSYRGDDSIASPTGKADQSFIDTCGGCHSRRGSLSDVESQASFHDQYRLALLDQGLYFADGRIDDEVFVLGSFLQSKMHARGVTCANCHEAHSGKVLAESNVLCAQCHKPEVYDSSEHHRHPVDSTGAECTACHMPERLYMKVDWRADHSFSIPDPALSELTGSPDACTACHDDRDRQWASESLNAWGVKPRQQRWVMLNHGMTRQDMLSFIDYARQPPGPDLTSIRQASLLSRISAFPSRLAVETAARGLNHSDPLVRRAAVSALQSMPAEVRWPSLSPLLGDPARSVRFEVAGALADVMPQLNPTDAAQLQKLLDEYRQSLEFNADSPGGQLALGNLDARLGFSILAENAYLRALEIEPGFVPALINLADLYRSTGRDFEAGELLIRATEVAPDSANAAHAYGLYLVRSGKSAEAMPYLAAAIDKEDTSPRHVYVYAVALDSSGQTGKAIEVIDQTSKDWPNNLDLSFLQVAYMDKTGNTQGIHRYLSLLAKVAANSPQVQAWMQKYSGS